MDVKMPVAPVASANSQLVLVGMFFNHGALPQPPGALPIVGMDSLQPTKLAHLVLVLSSKHLPAWADKETLSTRVRPPHHFGARRHQCAVASLALAHGDFFPASLLHQHRTPPPRQPNGK